MLTQGWRKYVWNEMNLKKYKQPRQQIILDGINGEVYYPDRRKKIPKEQTFVIAFSPNKDSAKVVIPADSAGRFEVSANRFKEWEDDYVFLKPFGPHKSQFTSKMQDPLTIPSPEYSLRIKFTDPFETINLTMSNNDIVYPIPGLVKEKEESPDLYTFGSDVVKIKEVTIKGKKRNIIRGKYLGILDSLAKDAISEDYVCRYGVLNCPRHDRNEAGTTWPIDGMEYYKMYFYNTPGETVRKIRYHKPFFPIYTEEELLKMNNLSRVKAYYGIREFYKPNYDKETDVDKVPDYRNTLLWEPSVITDENGEVTLSFFCSDINTDFVGRIEGVSNEGELGIGNFKFTVRKLDDNP